MTTLCGMSLEIIEVKRTISAPPKAPFAVVADPSNHQAIDTSGTLKGVPTEGVTRLALGSKFGMSMRMGLPYRMINEVVEFEDGRLISWLRVSLLRR